MFLLSLVSLIVLQFHLSLVVSIFRISIQCFTRHKKFQRTFRVGKIRIFFQRQEKSKTSLCFLTCHSFMIVTNNFVVRCDGVATFLRSVQSVHTMIPVSPGQCPCNFRTSAYLTIRIFWKMSDLIVFTTCSAEASSTSANFSSSVRSTSAIFEVAQIRSFFCSSWANLGGVRFRPFEIGGTLGPPGTEKVGGRRVGAQHLSLRFLPPHFALCFSVPGSRTTEIVRFGFSGNPNGTRRLQERHLWREDTKKSEHGQSKEGRSSAARSRGGEVQGKAQKSTTPRALTHAQKPAPTHAQKPAPTPIRLRPIWFGQPCFFDFGPFRSPILVFDFGQLVEVEIGRSRNWSKSSTLCVGWWSR